LAVPAHVVPAPAAQSFCPAFATPKHFSVGFFASEAVFDASAAWAPPAMAARDKASVAAIVAWVTVMMGPLSSSEWNLECSRWFAKLAPGE
jgi:hypothetical protein